MKKIQSKFSDTYAACVAQNIVHQFHRGVSGGKAFYTDKAGTNENVSNFTDQVKQKVIEKGCTIIKWELVELSKAEAENYRICPATQQSSSYYLLEFVIS